MMSVAAYFGHLLWMFPNIPLPSCWINIRRALNYIFATVSNIKSIFVPDRLIIINGLKQLLKIDVC